MKQLLISLLLLMLLLSGCKTQYVPVKEVHTEQVTRIDTFIQKDSVVLHDSVFIHSKGDTVWYEKWHTMYVDKWHDRIVVDSVIKIDSVPVPYPVPAENTAWEKVKISFGGYAMLLVLGAVAYLLFRIKKWFSIT